MNPLILAGNVVIVTLFASSYSCCADENAKSNERVSITWSEEQPHLLKISAGTEEPLSQILVVAWTEKANKLFLDQVKAVRIAKGLVDSLQFFSGWAKKEAADGSKSVLNGNYDNFSVAGVASRKSFGESRAFTQVVDPKTEQPIGILMCYTSSEMELGKKINEVLIDITNLDLPDPAKALWRNGEYIVVGTLTSDGKIERNWEITKASTPGSEKKKSSTKKAKKTTEPRPDKAPHPNPADYREWSDNTGSFKLEARFVSADRENVLLEKKETLAIISVPRARLSQDDRRFLEAVEKRTSDSRRKAKTAPADGPAPPVEVAGEAAREHDPEKVKEKTPLPPMPDAAAARAPIDSPTVTDILAAMDRNGFVPDETVIYIRAFTPGDESIAMYTFRNKKEREMSLRLTRNLVEFFALSGPGPKYKLNASPGAKNRRALLTVLDDLSPKLRAKCDECLAEFARKRGRAIDVNFEGVRISVDANGVTLKSADW